MIHWLIYAGLVVTPFIWAHGQADPARAPKMAFALLFALAISLMALYKGVLKPFRNKYALILVGFGLISFYLSPCPKLPLFGVEAGRFWSWECLYQILVFSLLAVTVASIELDKLKIYIMVDIMIWCGTVMAGLVILQALKLDQFFEWRFCDNGYMAGTLGNPTFIGPFLAMMVPLAIYRKKYLLGTLLIIPAVLVRCDVAIVSMVATLVAYLAFKTRLRLIAITGLSLIGLVAVGVLYFNVATFRETCPDNDRFRTWKQSITDVTHPVMKDSKKIYAITGIGPGSFKYLYHAKNDTGHDWNIYAHNDYIQVLYEQGIIGVGLFFMMFIYFFKRVIVNMSELKRALLASFVGIMAAAVFLFVFQFGTIIFYSLIVFGLLNNRYIQENLEESCLKI